MPYQTNANVLVAVRRETTTGVAAGATASLAAQVRITDSPGLVLKKAQIQSTEKRTDMLRPMARLGHKTVDGSYNTELTVGGAVDLFLEAAMRSAWATATSIAFSSMTTVALGTNTVTAAAGDWIGTAGVRVGDLFTISGTTVPGDNGTNARVTALSTLVITTTTGAFTTLAATATGTLTILKKLKTVTPPNRYTHTIEQYDVDTDLSELFLGCRLIGLKVSGKPGAPVTMAYTFMGLDHTVLATGTSPYFTTPALTTGLALIADDATVHFNGTQVANFTGFDLDFSIAAKDEAVIGSLTSPDVFDNDLTVTGSITALRQDFSNLSLYDAETEFEVRLKFIEPNTTPQNCLGFFFPRVKIGAVSAPAGGADGAKIETVALFMGPKVATSTYDAGVATIHSTAP